MTILILPMDMKLIPAKFHYASRCTLLVVMLVALPCFPNCMGMELIPFQTLPIRGGFSVDNGYLLSVSSRSMAAYELSADGNWKPSSSMPELPLLHERDTYGGVNYRGNIATIRHTEFLDGEFFGKTVVFQRRQDYSWEISGEVPAGIVSTDGQRILLGLPSSHPELATAFVYGAADDLSWQQEDELSRSFGNFHDDYAKNLTISGDTAVVTAYDTWLDRVEYPWTGSAFVFQRQTDGEWEETQVLETGEIGNFGYSIDSDGDRFIVGDLADELRATARARIYQKESNGQLELAQEIIDADFRSVREVAIGGDSAIIQTHIGALLYQRNYEGVWVQMGEFLRRTDSGILEGIVGRGFARPGGSIEIDGDYAFILGSDADVHVYKLPVVPEPGAFTLSSIALLVGCSRWTRALR